MVRVLLRDGSAVSNWVAFALAVVIAVAIVGVYLVYLVTPPPAGPNLAQLGDTVRIDYVGTFPESGAVFDTSLPSVANNNASYEKAFSFTWRAAWSALSFTIGDGSVVAGFDRGVRGLQVGESATLVVPPSEGYGAANPALISVHSLTEPVPVVTTWNESAFVTYFKTSPVSGSAVTDPVWGWTDSVAVVNGYATVTASPVPGQAIRPYGAWDAQVLSIDDTANNGTGVILVQHRLDPLKADLVGGVGPNGQKFYLSSVDLSAGTYTLNYNRQVVGRTLVFQITLLSISRL